MLPPATATFGDSNAGGTTKSLAAVAVTPGRLVRPGVWLPVGKASRECAMCRSTWWTQLVTVGLMVNLVSECLRAVILHFYTLLVQRFHSFEFWNIPVYLWSSNWQHMCAMRSGDSFMNGTQGWKSPGILAHCMNDGARMRWAAASLPEFICKAIVVILNHV